MMTNDLIKTDRLGRLIVCREHREALLDEFERGAMTGTIFARHHGLKYQTFAFWMQKRRCARRDYEPLRDTRGPTPPKALRPSPPKALRPTPPKALRPTPPKALRPSPTLAEVEDGSAD